jgi:hypothetical protein
MPRFSVKKMNSSELKRYFTLVRGNKEHGLFYGSKPSAAALMVATKLCTSSKSKEGNIVEFNIKEITQDSKKKIYGPYIGYIDKLKGRGVQSYKIVAKLKKVEMKGGEETEFKVFVGEEGSSKSSVKSYPLRLEKTVTKNDGSVAISSAILIDGPYAPFSVMESTTIALVVGKLIIIASTDGGSFNGRSVYVFKINSPGSKEITSSDVIYLKNLERLICNLHSKRAYQKWQYKVISLESSNSGTFCLTIQELNQEKKVIRMIVTITIDDYKNYLEDKNISIRVE